MQASRRRPGGRAAESGVTGICMMAACIVAEEIEIGEQERGVVAQNFEEIAGETFSQQEK